MTLAITVSLLTGITTPAATAFWGKSESDVKKAKRYFDSREYYKARTTLQKVLNKTPHDAEAQKLMAQILDKEIERQKEQLLPQAIEEMNSDEKQQEIKTWLERSQTLFSMKQYDMALFAAEKVFLYDYENNEASELIDRIKGQALKEGKADTLFIHKMYKEEIADRLARYRNQGKELLDEGQFGQARFTAEKILLLEPEDPQALSLLGQILSQEQRMKGDSV